MITRIEIDGFKTFRNFQMEFSPLTVVAGPNASGKSNLFDALQLLARLAETDLKTAFSEQRGEAIELFTQYSDDEYAPEMRFTIDMLINKSIKDNWGGEAMLKYTRLIYSIHIRRLVNERGLNELSVVSESLNPIRHNEDTWIKKFVGTKTRNNWRPEVKIGKRGLPYIDTQDKNGTPTIIVSQDGRSGNKRELPITVVSQTVLSSFNSVDFPHAFAAREEMRSWQFLQLNPESLRKPSPYLSKDVISSNGENLAAVLHRIKTTNEYALPAISRRLNDLLPNLTEVNVWDDTANKQFLIKIKSEDGREFTSRVLSEGTLRLLALCVFQYDDTNQGLICFEEPENGIHPARISTMVQLLKDLSVDFDDTEGALRQVIVNTHSPVLVSEVFSVRTGLVATVWLSQLVTQVATIGEKKRKMAVTKLLPIQTAQTTLSYAESETRLTLGQAVRYLQSADFEKAIDVIRNS
jgi:predicted ATPase